MSLYVPKPDVETRLFEFSGAYQLIQGVSFRSKTTADRYPKTAAIFVHGTEAFWSSPPNCYVAGSFASNGVPSFVYNGVHSGGTFRSSEFELAVSELGELVLQLTSTGVEHFIICGHSLGTPIVQAFAASSHAAQVAAIMLYGPHINIPYVTQHVLLGPNRYQEFLNNCRSLVSSGRGEEILLLPHRQGRSIVTSAKTFLSYRDIETSKANVEPIIKDITAPIFIAYDDMDNFVSSDFEITRASITQAIKSKATGTYTVDIVLVPSHDSNTPVDAHLFRFNERRLADLSIGWLDKIFA